ncbi:MAG: NFACT family protein [Clostridia bacterium]|nr:NFACT family protein [Clostridia bacterium]
MPLDYMMTGAIVRELGEKLTGAKADKIYMPQKDRVVISLHGQGGKYRLLLAAGTAGHINLTDTREENPDSPPMLCMLLRKHLLGGRVLAVTQPENERVAELRFGVTSELGVQGERRLICELAGRTANIILTDGEGTILGCVRAIDPSQSERAVLPGLTYRLPPKQETPHIAELSAEELRRICADCGGEAEMLGKRISGVPPLLMRECAFRAGGDAGRLAEELDALRRTEPQPYMLMQGGEARDFTCVEVRQHADAECVRYGSFSELLDAFYAEKERRQALSGAAANMQKLMKRVKARLERKLAQQAEELRQAEAREELKRRADLINANLYAIKEGQERVQVTDYFAPDTPQVWVTLDPALSPQQNAQRMYKKYARLKNAQQALETQMELGRAELEYAESVLFAISAAENRAELEQIAEELRQAGYLRERGKKQKAREPAFAPKRYELAGGWVLLCGRNNRENDWLTHRHAAKQDLWFHARNIPGAHVILRGEGGEPPREALEAAASLAAYNSSARGQNRTAVDYTRIKHVKKPQGAKPGMVNYFEYTTVMAVPAEPETPKD